MQQHRLRAGFAAPVDSRQSSSMNTLFFLVEGSLYDKSEAAAEEVNERTSSGYFTGMVLRLPRLIAKCLRLPAWSSASIGTSCRAPYLASLLALILVCFAASFAGAETIVVDGTSIQGAINIAQAGDMVVVIGATESNPRLYPERVDFGSSLGADDVIVIASPRRSVVMYGFWTRGAGDGLTIEGFQITIPDSVLAADPSAVHSLRIESNFIEVRDNYIFDAPGTAIVSYFAVPFWSGGHIVGNRMFRCGAGISILNGNDWLIENNEVERLVDKDIIDADYSRAWGNNITFRNNYFHGSIVSEIGTSHVDGFQTFAENGLELHGLVFENNIVSDFGQGMILTSDDFPGAISDVTIRNNIFDGGNFEENGSAFGILLTFEGQNFSITHNVFANTGIHGVFLAKGATATVQNNIFYDAGTNLFEDPAFATATSLIRGYNLFSTEGFADDLLSTDVAYFDPLFVNPGNWAGPDGIPFTADDGVRLLSGSPAIDAGTNAGATQDIFGTMRPQGGLFDIGPYEFLSSDPPPPPPPTDDGDGGGGGGGGGCAGVIWTDGSTPPGGDFLLLLLVVLPILRHVWRRLRHPVCDAANEI